MKNNYLIIIFIIFTFYIVHTAPLYAYGVGFYTTGKVGVQYPGIGANYGIGCGFVYDSAVASNERFNYRLNAGYENCISTTSPPFYGNFMHRVTLSNTFGFALFSSRYVRVWMGPQIELACQFAERTWTSNAGTVPGLSYMEKTTHTKSTHGQFGIGGILGINVHAGELFTLGFEVGLNAIMDIGRYESSESGFGIVTLPPISPQISPTTPVKESRDQIRMKVDTLMRINFIFRVGDEYVLETPDVTDIKLLQK